MAIFLREIIGTFPVRLTGINIQSEALYGIILNSAINPPDEVVDWVKIHYPECFDSVQRFLSATLKSLKLLVTTTRTKASHTDLRFLSQKVLWEDVRISMQEIRINGHQWVEIQHMPHGVKILKVCAYYAVRRQDRGRA
jgi:hypothetical protein